MEIISIIVSIYNIEKYLPRCLQSIYQQSFKDFECILVDDGSTDNSKKICDDYVKLDKRFIVIHKNNQGLPLARKSGFEKSKGKYLLFVDGDDWLEPDMLERLYKSATESNSEIVICGYYKDFQNKTLIYTPNIPELKEKCLNEFASSPYIMNYFWNKLIKRELFNNPEISFPSNISLCEDLFVTFKLLYFCNNISQIKAPLYHYIQTNSNSITKNYKQKSFDDKIYVTDDISNFLVLHNENKKYCVLINFYKLYSKLLLIIYKNLRNENLWMMTYPEANKFIWKVPLRFDYKIMSWLCSKKMFKLAYLIQDIKNKK